MKHQSNPKPGWLAAAAIVVLSTFLGATTGAEPPEAYRKLWRDPAVNERIERNIEKYRKGDATLEVISKDGKPLSGAKIELQQTGHEFLFGCNAFVLGLKMGFTF